MSTIPNVKGCRSEALIMPVLPGKHKLTYTLEGNLSEAECQRIVNHIQHMVLEKFSVSGKVKSDRATDNWNYGA